MKGGTLCDINLLCIYWEIAKKKVELDNLCKILSVQYVIVLQLNHRPKPTYTVAKQNVLFNILHS